MQSAMKRPLIVFCPDLHREAFEPMMESGELVVRYRARRTYSRRTTEATRELPPFMAPCMSVGKICNHSCSSSSDKHACPNLPVSPG